MNPAVQEWLNLVVRWAHVIAAIMWIGDSFLFMWLDSQLSKPDREAARATSSASCGWRTRGGFYEVVKRKSLADAAAASSTGSSGSAYTTWVTGFLLLVIVYYLGGARHAHRRAARRCRTRRRWA